MSKVEAPSQGLEVRRLAVLLLRHCLERRVTVEEAIAGHEAARNLPARDRALLATLLLTAFRHRGEIAALLESVVERPLPRKSGPTREILEIGVAQLSFLAMAPHAVIDLAVRSAKADRNALHFAGLVNAVLRKIASGGGLLREELDAPRLNTPGWLWERWTKTYGEDLTHRMARSHAERPALDLSFRVYPGPWERGLGGTPLPNGQLRLPSGHAPVPELSGYAEGAWWVQDAAATFPVHLMGSLHGKSVLDLCAAPGGKTLQMAAMGANVTAVDVSEQRLRRLRDNLARTRLNAEIRILDLLTDDLAGEWDAVLLDAPCSATGTIRRHPELPWLRDATQIRELSALQRRMLQKAVAWVKPGGLLVYCTCSLEPEEGEAQVERFLARYQDFDLVPATNPALPAGAVQAEGWLRTLPCMNYGGTEGMDGFFAAALRRRA